ncbi:hypothetical protein [Microbacterium thalli]|uniref:hypothetical protein n=1 Tax=Microbacterium thalli TaxID=3027921 RepID=UPI002365D3C4|nr:hypothetical protein [Microbacterium thalli]MDD7929696.1 hypothetical protein [Microbacterium thalli]
MAIGDDAAGAGMELVPDTGENGKVKYGAREINRTRDYTAQRTKRSAPNIAIHVGSTAPANPVVGHLWFEPI